MCCDIAAMECSPEFARLNFELADYIDKNGEPRRLFEITRNGFFFLAMGYRGTKAALVKEAYIARFDAMAAELAQRPSPAPLAETVTVAPGQGRLYPPLGAPTGPQLPGCRHAAPPAHAARAPRYPAPAHHRRRYRRRRRDVQRRRLQGGHWPGAGPLP